MFINDVLEHVLQLLKEKRQLQQSSAFSRMWMKSNRWESCSINYPRRF